MLTLSLLFETTEGPNNIQQTTTGQIKIPIHNANNSSHNNMLTLFADLTTTTNGFLLSTTKTQHQPPHQSTNQQQTIQHRQQYISASQIKPRTQPTDITKTPFPPKPINNYSSSDEDNFSDLPTTNEHENIFVALQETNPSSTLNIDDQSTTQQQQTVTDPILNTNYRSQFEPLTPTPDTYQLYNATTTQTRPTTSFK